MLSTLFLTGLTTFPMPVLGATWIVDDDAGPGVDFTSIQAAVDAASPNDVVLVRAGAYAAPTISKGLRVVGDGAAAISGVLRVQQTPSGSIAVVSGLRSTNGNGHGVLVASCAGSVVAEDLEASFYGVTDSFDVRVRGNLAPAGGTTLQSTSSRVEVVECAFRGAAGPDQFCGLPFDPTGQSAAVVDGGELHAARSSFEGGDGGDSTCGDLGLVEPGGDGGHGVVVFGGATALVTGVASNALAGGDGGWSFLYGDASDGRGVFAWSSSSARVSGATVESTGTSGTGVVTTATPADPTLRMLELPAPGVNLTLRLTAPAGATAELRVGGAPAVVPVGGLEEDVLVGRAQSIPMGVVPAGGVLGANFRIPAHWPRGSVAFAQAVVTYPGGEVRRTHSVPLVVR